MLPRRIMQALLLTTLLAPAAWALPTCSDVAGMVNQQTGNRLDTAELGSVLQALEKPAACRISSFPSVRRAAGWLSLVAACGAFPPCKANPLVATGSAITRNSCPRGNGGKRI
jgi:hypothetical protein